ncbi:hypothetical protein [Carboxylicivirga caseinilyticus]|uniref:hypothetical protein n=1 Tax=Carboxylicivirga caseinilyticus TaxID=3417572 RepID=UPI003D357F8F|nr:hypothetical protein [Marinilabiliaceae bacterium A049]
MRQKDKILEIVNSAQQKLSSEKLSIILNDCLRVAMLRNDFENQWWLHWEFCTTNGGNCKKKFPETIRHKFSVEKYQILWKEYLDEWINERRAESINLNVAIIESDKIYSQSVIEIENNLEFAENSTRNLIVPSNLDSKRAYEIEIENFEARQVLESSIKDYRNILGRIKLRASNFLNDTEYELQMGKTYSDIFARTKELVDIKLAEIAPDVLEKFLSIKIESENKEEYAQSLVTCRRVLKSFADSIYPPSKIPVKCSDGKERLFSEEKYIARIWQFIHENFEKSTSTSLIQNQLSSLGKRVDYIYELSNKGIHADVDELEANQCIIQTYLILGDILRIKMK